MGHGRLDVAVADGLAVRFEVLEQRAREVELRDPEAHAAVGPGPVAVRREERDRSVVRQPHSLARLRVEEREARGIGRLSQLDDAEAGGEGRGEVDVDRGAVGARAVERRRERAAGVDDDDVAFAEESRQVAESRVLDAAAALRRDHESHAVAREAAGFGRLGGFELRREVESDAGVSDRVLSASCFLASFERASAAPPITRRPASPGGRRSGRSAACPRSGRRCRAR